MKSKKEGESDFILFLFDFIWYNKNFKINGKTVFNPRLFNIGVWSANDLYKNGHPVPFQFWVKLGTSQSDFMVWRGLIQHCLTERGIN